MCELSGRHLVPWSRVVRNFHRVWYAHTMRMIDPETHLTAIHDPDAQRIAVNPTLNSDLVAQAKALTGNLSSKVDVLQTEFGASEHESLGGCRWGLARAAEEGGRLRGCPRRACCEFSTL